MVFFKMQGLGNDYVYLDCTKGKEPDNIEELAVRLSNRHFGIGSDGLILLCTSEIADLKMRMFNLDGSEAQMCGNGIRCVAKLAYDLGLIKNEIMTIETLAGIKILKLNLIHGKVNTVEVDMGEPILEAEAIPVLSEEKYTIKLKRKILDQEFEITCVSMGNPHAVILVDDVEKFPIKIYGPIIEKEGIFPEKTNVEFVQIVDKEHIKMRVWERGSGETLACGTGACASTVACILNELIEPKVTVQLTGGNLEIVWNKENNHVYMTGPAVTVFKGEWIND